MAQDAKQKIAESADQTEWHSVLHGFSAIDEGARDEEIASALHDHEPAADDALGDFEKSEHKPLEWPKHDLAIDNIVGEVRAEIIRRVACMDNAYPFELVGNSLKHRGDGCDLYTLLLLISLFENIAQQNSHAPSFFEQISAQIVAAYFGEYAMPFHTGFPRDPNVSFEDKMREIQKSTGEFVWGPDEGANPSNIKDAGMDFVVALPHADDRKDGQLFAIGQCACGRNWEEKLDSLQIRKIQKWFNPMTQVSPVKVFSTPRHVVDEKLKDASRRAGLLFDRARLVCAVKAASRIKKSVFDSKTQKRMEKLTQTLRKEYNAL